MKKAFALLLIIFIGALSCKKSEKITESNKPLQLSITDLRTFKNSNLFASSEYVSPPMLSFPSEIEWRNEILLDHIEAYLFEKLAGNAYKKKADLIEISIQKLDVMRYKSLENDFIMVNFIGELTLTKDLQVQKHPLYSYQIILLKSLLEILDENQLAADIVLLQINEYLL